MEKEHSPGRATIPPALDAGTPTVPETLTVPEDAHGMRLDRFLGESLRACGVSREKSKQAIADGKVLLNGVVVSQGKTAIRAGDSIALRLEAPVANLAPEEGELRVLYRDAHIAVLDKPPHLTVHPSPSQMSDTLAGRLLAHFPELAAQEGMRPGIVHRLDKDTSGLLVAALTEKDRLALSRSFAEREVSKEYLALVRGVPAKPRGEVREPLGRHPTIKTKMAVVPLDKGGREAFSEYRVLYADPTRRFSLLAVAIHTGRTHQIRVHMAAIGHPLWGDAVYGRTGQDAPGTPVAPRQMLHAWKLSFKHPSPPGEDDVLSFTCPPPKDFQDFVMALAAPLTRLVITGSPGCGKSSLLGLLEEMGASVWSADAAVRESYAQNGDGTALIRARYGERFIAPDGSVDRPALFTAMRGDDSIRREVERLIHPLARHALDAFWETHAATPRDADGFAMAVAEVPLYLESGWRSESGNGSKPGQQNAPLDAPEQFPPLLATVYCPFPVRAARLREKRGWNDTTIAAMESWQWPEEQKVRAADLVVDNSGDITRLRSLAQALVGTVKAVALRRRKQREHFLRSLWKK